MKFVIVLACLLAVAYANDDRGAVTTGEKVEVNPDGFLYAVDTSNGIYLEQNGHLADDKNQVVKGSYKYTAPNGHEVEVVYTADEHGYHPTVVKS